MLYTRALFNQCPLSPPLHIETPRTRSPLPCQSFAKQLCFSSLSEVWGGNIPEKLRDVDVVIAADVVYPTKDTNQRAENSISMDAARGREGLATILARVRQGFYTDSRPLTRTLSRSLMASETTWRCQEPELQELSRASREQPLQELGMAWAEGFGVCWASGFGSLRCRALRVISV